MATDPKKSTAAIGNISPLTDYADGLTNYYVADQYKRSYPVRRDGDAISSVVDANAYEPGTGEVDDPKDPDPIKEPKEDPRTRTAPTLDDIEVVSNTVVYDAAKNPSATVVFKIRNSSGEAIKAVNYRVSIA
jgi:hypothetical protein